MSAEVVSLAAVRQARAAGRRDRLRAQAEVRDGMVVLLARDRDSAYTPAAGRSLANRLLGLCDMAEGIPGSTLGEAELRARLTLLAEAVDRFDRGAGRVSDLMALLRQLTAEVRRG